MTAPAGDRPWLCPRDETCPNPYPKRHDTITGYRWGCQSGAAREHTRRVRKRQRLGMQPSVTVPALGAQRRLQALAFLGWTAEALCARTDCITPVYLRSVMRGERQTVYRETHDGIVDLFARLAMEPGPSAISAKRAKAKGWAPPLAWDNPDNPSERPKFGRADEGREQLDLTGAVRRLTLNGLSAVKIADRLGTTPRTVERYRARIAEQVAA